MLWRVSITERGLHNGPPEKSRLQQTLAVRRTLCESVLNLARHRRNQYAPTRAGNRRSEAASSISATATAKANSTRKRSQELSKPQPDCASGSTRARPSSGEHHGAICSPGRGPASDRFGSHIAAAKGNAKGDSDGPANIVPLQHRKGAKWAGPRQPGPSRSQRPESGPTAKAARLLADSRSAANIGTSENYQGQLVQAGAAKGCQIMFPVGVMFEWHLFRYPGSVLCWPFGLERYCRTLFSM
jgi:hypothetical protein